MTLAVLLTCVIARVVDARNVKPIVSINDAMQSANIDGSVRFFFAQQKAPAVAKRLGSASVHEKVSTRPERDEESCKAAFREALQALQKRAQRAGADAVVNIVSYFRNETTASPTEFQCHAGAAAHVLLRGEWCSWRTKIRNGEVIPIGIASHRNSPILLAHPPQVDRVIVQNVFSLLLRRG